MSDESPTEVSIGSPSVDTSDAQATAEAGLLDFAMNFVAGDQPQESAAEETETEQQSDEMSTETEELVDTEAEDNTEAEEAAEMDEDDPEGEPLETDIDLLSFEELSSQVGKIEIGGKEYSPAQLKSILGQEEAAGTKARKAAEELKQVEERRAELETYEAQLQSRSKAVEQSGELAQMANAGKQLQEQLQKARQAEDYLQVSKINDQLTILNQRYQSKMSEVQTVEAEVRQQKLNSFSKSLTDQGYGKLLEDSPEAAAWQGYVKKSGLDQAAVNAAIESPQLAIALEKARLYDEISSKKGAVLKNASKSLKPSSNKVKSKSSGQKKKAEYQANPDAYFLDLAKDVLAR